MPKQPCYRCTSSKNSIFHYQQYHRYERYPRTISHDDLEKIRNSLAYKHLWSSTSAENENWLLIYTACTNCIGSFQYLFEKRDSYPKTYDPCIIS